MVSKNEPFYVIAVQRKLPIIFIMLYWVGLYHYAVLVGFFFKSLLNYTPLINDRLIFYHHNYKLTEWWVQK